MNKNIKQTLRYLIEIVIVAFGVFLGFYLNTIKEDKKVSGDKEKALTAIVKELELNRDLLEEAMTYHKIIKPQIDSVFAVLSLADLKTSFFENEKFNYVSLKGWDGFQYARLQNTAYEGARLSGMLKEFDLSFIRGLSGIYSEQKDYLDYAKMLMNRGANADLSTTVFDFAQILQLMTSDLLEVEKELKMTLDSTLIQIQEDKRYSRLSE